MFYMNLGLVPFFDIDSFPEELDPYEVLKIPYNASPEETKLAFRKRLINTNRSATCLSYDMICNKENYIQNKKTKKFKVKKKDQFYYVHVGGLDKLILIIENDSSIINQKDNLGRSLLYLAARNGYINICLYLLRKGANVNDTQKTGSTPLHGASYYGNEMIVQLLLQYGANTKIRNKFSNYASDEGQNSLISNNIKKFEDDIIYILLNNLNSNHLSNGMKILKREGIVIGKKILRNTNLKGISNIEKDWILCWHGTNFNSLESIMENGLIVPGSKLKDDVELEPKSNHIDRDVPVDGIEDWAKAIFVSPSIFYALDTCYSERIESQGEKWGILIETKVKPCSYISRGSTVKNYVLSKNEPVDVEYRIESENDVTVTSIVFVKCSYIEKNKNYNNISSIFKDF